MINDIGLEAMAGLAQKAKAWPFEEARKIIARIELKADKPKEIIFETGYGPSGLPHIGTFGEVLRTTMVRYAFSQLSDIPTRLICFSDDMDGMRKVPTNVPNQDMLQHYIDVRLTKVPDPFEKYESFAHHNNAMLRQFLDQFGFEYEFASSSEYYASGRFDQGLMDILTHYDEIMAIMLPSFRAERAQNYSPFLPVDQETGKVLQASILDRDPKNGTLLYLHPNGKEVSTKVTGGHCKLQWKPDWGMRWHVLGIDYEMSGKDLIDSVKLSSRICKAIGSRPPEGFNYELFLDQNGEKISKSRGNGLSMEEWLRYAPSDSLAYFMFVKPKAGKRLYFDIIPKNVDEYYGFLDKYEKQTWEERLENPIWHIHHGKTPAGDQNSLSFSMLLNLVSASNSQEESILWGFISRYIKDATATTHPHLGVLVKYAIRYYQDFILPHKAYQTASVKDQEAIRELRDGLQALSLTQHDDVDIVQNLVYSVGKRHGYENLRDWFKALYSILLGQEQGPRMGSFFVIFGIERTIMLIDEALERNQ